MFVSHAKLMGWLLGLVRLKWPPPGVCNMCVYVWIMQRTHNMWLLARHRGAEKVIADIVCVLRIMVMVFCVCLFGGSVLYSPEMSTDQGSIYIYSTLWCVCLWALIFNANFRSMNFVDILMCFRRRGIVYTAATRI